ncbi:MAG: tetratricopeptide repeat protein [Flavobacteriales bacterium]
MPALTKILILLFISLNSLHVLMAQLLDLSPGMQHVQLGDNKMRINDWEGAVLEYTTAIRVDPNLADAYYKRSIVYTKLARLREAEEDRLKALLMNPKIEKFYDERAIQAMLVLDRGSAKGDYSEALIYDTRYPIVIAESDSSEIAVFLRNANVESLSSHIKKNKKDTTAVLQRALRYLMAENFDLALNDVNQFIRPGDKSAKAFEIRGLIQMKQGNFAYSIDEFNKSLEFNPYCGETFFNRGISRLVLGDLSGALRDFQSAEQINPDLWEAAYNAGIIQLSRERFADAVSEFDKAIRIKSNIGYIFFYRGLARYGINAFQGAFDDFERSWQLGEYRKESLNNKGIIHLYFNEKKEAIRDFSDALREVQDYAPALYNRGLAHILSSLRILACQDLNQSAMLDFVPAIVAVSDFCR